MRDLDLTDDFTAIDYLFLGGDTPGCLAALDTNGDAHIDLADVASLLLDKGSPGVACACSTSILLVLTAASGFAGMPDEGASPP